MFEFIANCSTATKVLAGVTILATGATVASAIRDKQNIDYVMALTAAAEAEDAMELVDPTEGV